MNNFPQKAEVVDGVLRFEDGEAVQLWGVNFQSCLYWEQGFRREPLGLPGDHESIKTMTDQGFREIVELGCDCIRAHLTPADYTDDQGNLIENMWLDMVGYTVAKAREHGVYVTLAFLNQMEYSLVRHSFIANCPRKDWLFDAGCVQASYNFIRQLLNWKNPYTGIRLKDDSAIIAWEPVNEPEYITYAEMKVNPSYRKEFAEWVSDCDGAFNDWYFSLWREDKVRRVINAFHGLLRGEGAEQPIIWNCNWPRMLRGHEDVFKGIAKSKADAVAFCCYPGQDEVGDPFIKSAADTSGKNYLPYLQRCHDDEAHLGWVNLPEFRKKAVVVYEFEAMYNAVSGYLYPAMAMLFRSLRVQMATLWTWSFAEYADRFSGSHLFHPKVTPAKAIGFLVAGEIFRNTNSDAPLAFSGEAEHHEDGLLISQTRNLAVWAQGELLMHSDRITEAELPESWRPKKIIGRGGSPFVNTDGTGLYWVDFEKDDPVIKVLPNVEFTREPWRWWMDGKIVAQLGEARPVFPSLH